MKRTRIYNIVISTLIILLLVGVYVSQTGETEDDNDLVRNLTAYNGTYTTAKLTDKPVETHTISLSEGVRNLTIDQGNKVVWTNNMSRSKIILMIKGETPIFETQVEGFSETSWIFVRKGTYTYYVDDVNTTGRIEVR